MKFYKKITVFIIAITICMSAITIAGYASQQPSSLSILIQLGFIIGDGTGDYAEDKIITRAEAAVIVCRIMGWEALEAKEMPFADLKTGNSVWVAKYAAILFEKGVTVGVSTEEKIFAPNKEITEKELYVWFYRAMFSGAEDAWGSPQLLIEKGLAVTGKVAQLVYDEKKQLFPARKIIFDDMIDILTREINGASQLERLCENNKALRAKAENLGLIEKSDDAEPRILGGSLLNYSQLLIRWNKGADTNMEAYSIGDTGEIYDLTANAAGTEVVLTFRKPNFSAQQDLTVYYGNTYLVIDGIIDANAPTVKNIEVAGKNKIKVIFSEPMQDIPVMSINLGAISVNEYPEINASHTEFTYSTGELVDQVTYSIRVEAGAKDTAGLALKNDFTTSFVYSKVVDTVRVVVKEATSRRIVLELSSQTYGVLSKENFTYILDENHPKSVALLEDKKTIVLDLNDYPAPTGIVWNLNIVNADIMFVDEWGNTAPSTLSVPFSATDDGEKPLATLRSFEQASGQMEILFSEYVDISEMTILMYKEEDPTERIVFSTIGMEDKVLVCHFNKLAFKGGAYRIEVSGAKDDAGNVMDTYTTTVIAKSMKDVSVQSIEFETENGMAVRYYIQFSNEMDIMAMDVNTWTLSRGSIAEVLFIDDARTKLMLELTAPINDGANMKITAVPTLSDVDGNRITGATTMGAVMNEAGESGTVQLTELVGGDIISQTIVTATSGNTVVFKIPASIDYTSIDLNNISFNAGGYTTTADSYTTTAEFIGNVYYNTIIVKLKPFAENTELDANATYAGNSLTASVINLKTAKDATLNIVNRVVLDGIRPEITNIQGSIIDNKTTIYLTSTELLQSRYVDYIATELKLSYKGEVLKAGIDYTISILNGTIKVDIAKTENNAVVTISLSEDSAYVTDTNNNLLKPFSKSIIITQ